MAKSSARSLASVAAVAATALLAAAAVVPAAAGAAGNDSGCQDDAEITVDGETRRGNYYKAVFKNGDSDDREALVHAKVKNPNATEYDIDNFEQTVLPKHVCLQYEHWLKSNFGESARVESSQTPHTTVTEDKQTVTINVTLKPTRDCSDPESYSDFSGYTTSSGNRGRLVVASDTRPCYDPDTEADKPIAGAKAKKGSSGGEGDTGALRRPDDYNDDYNPPPAGPGSNDGTSDGSKPGAEPEAQPDGGPETGPDSGPGTPPDNGIEPDAQQQPESQPNGGIGSQPETDATADGTPDSQPDPAPERSAEQQFNDDYDSDGDGCLSSGEYGNAISGIGRSNWNEISQPDAFRDAHSRRC